jgi:hypothetical protein
MRPYTIGTGSFSCCVCGKKARKHYTPITSIKPYCSNCINSITGVTVPTEELTVPIWLIEIADMYVNYRLFMAQSSGQKLEEDEFALNFYRIPFGVKIDTKDNAKGFVAIDAKNLKIGGKPVKEGWIIAVHNHISNRRKIIKENELKPIRKDIICPECKSSMYYTGSALMKWSEGYFTPYRCLSAKDVCKASKENHLFGYNASINLVRRVQ